MCNAANAQRIMVMGAGDSLRAAGNVDGAIEEFRKEYAVNPKNQFNLYSYACALSVVGSFDSSFKYLNLYMQVDTEAFMMVDPDFNHIRADKRWEEIENRMVAMLEHKTGKALGDPEYAKKLWRMRAIEQAYYAEIKLAEKNTMTGSTVVRALWDLKAMLSDQNQQELEKLIAKKGWPKKSAVGNVAAETAYLIGQRSDLDKLNKYLPTIKKLCEQGEADWNSYALMYDRVQTAEGKPQRYGSQIRYNAVLHKYELFPLENDKKVDEWRKQVGLGPLKDYAIKWGIDFAPQASGK